MPVVDGRLRGHDECGDGWYELAVALRADRMVAVPSPLQPHFIVLAAQAAIHDKQHITRFCGLRWAPRRTLKLKLHAPKA